MLEDDDLDSDETEEEDAGPRITREIEWPEKVGPSVNFVLKSCAALGWELKLAALEWDVPAVLFAKGNDDHEAGQVRYPAKTVTVLVIGAKHPQINLAFRVEFHDGKWKEAEVADPVGVLRETYFDYSPTKNQMRRVKDEPEWAWKARVKELERLGAQMNYDYNDNSLIKLYRAHMKNATEWKTWLTDWVEMLAPKPEPKPKRTTKKKEPQPA